VSNFDPSGYQRVTSLSTADALIVSSLIVGENGNRIHNAGKLESSHLGDNRPKIDGDNTTPEPQSQSEEITTKSSSGNQLSYLENVDRSFRRMGIHQGQLPLRTQSRHFGIDPNDGD